MPQLREGGSGTADRPRVSVVMCTYNGLPFIWEAVADVLGQTYEDFELVISNDASTDGTREWLEEHARDPRIRLLHQPRNLGYLRNKNAAIAQARGELITQLDSDDRSHPDRLRLMVDAIDRSGLDMVGCGYQRLSVGGAVLNTVAPAQERVQERPPARGQAYSFWFPAILASRRVYEAVGNYPEYFSGAFGDDHYWTVRANERFPILCLPQPLYGYRDAPSSITSMLNDPRKLVIVAMLEHLLEQRRHTGTDDLERGDLAALAAREQALLQDGDFLSRQYQVYAARSIDQGRLGEGAQLLWQATASRPRLALLRTWLYLLRSRLKKDR